MKFRSSTLKYCCSLKGRLGWQNLRSDEFPILPSKVRTIRAIHTRPAIRNNFLWTNSGSATDFTPNDELFWEQVREDATADETVPNAGEANPRDNFAYVFDRKFEELVINRMDRNSDQAVRFLDNPEMQQAITHLIRDQVYDRIQDQAKARAATV